MGKNIENKITKCWIFGDESGRIGKDRFFAIGIIGTRFPNEVASYLKDIRKKTNYFDEVSYKSPNQKRVLCAIRWTDWFFGGQKIAHYKILIKDANEFKVDYFSDNKYKAKAHHLAYCESYKEVLCNFADYNNDKKGLIYSQIGLAKMKIEEHLDEKIVGLKKENCFSRYPDKKKKDGSEYTGVAEILQLCDLLTGSTRGLHCSLSGEEISETWDKNTLRKNIHYYIPKIKDELSANRNIYFPSYSPYKEQIFVVYNWRGGSFKMPKRP